MTQLTISPKEMKDNNIYFIKHYRTCKIIENKQKKNKKKMLFVLLLVYRLITFPIKIPSFLPQT